MVTVSRICVEQVQKQVCGYQSLGCGISTDGNVTLNSCFKLHSCRAPLFEFTEAN